MSSSSPHDDTSRTGERAVKRRRLDPLAANAATNRFSNPGEAQHSQATTAQGALSVREDISDNFGRAVPEPLRHVARFSALPSPAATDARPWLYRRQDVAARVHEPQFSMDRETHVDQDSTLGLWTDHTGMGAVGSSATLAGALPTTHLHDTQNLGLGDRANAAVQHQSSLGLPEHGMDGLEAIDLTAVNNSSSLRHREQIDDEARRMRREASMKIEARRKANAQMLKSTLEQQAVDTAKAEDMTTAKGIGSLQCVICMDNFTDMTATHCGHLFCHTCINEHLITAEMARGYPAAKPLCPFCRTPVFREPTRKGDKERSIVPLTFKVRPKPVAVSDKGKHKQVEVVD